MKQITLAGHKIELYDDIEDTPIRNFQKFNKYALVDAGIGSNYEDIDSHIVRVAQLIGKDNEKAVRELQNLHRSLYMVLSEISPDNLSFAALIHSIDGEVVEDITDDGLKRVLAKIELATEREVRREQEAVKKKLDTELETYFPSLFSNARRKDADAAFRRKLILQLDEVIYDRDNSKDIGAIESEALAKYKPMNFDGSESVSVLSDKQFEHTCLVIAQESGLDPKRMSVMQFYASLEQINKQNKERAKQFKKR